MTHWPHDEALSKSKLPIDEVIAAGANRLLARASNGRSLDVDSLVPRVRATVEKYLLKHDADAALDAISSFIDTLHADDLCLAIACRRGDQAAWSDLVEGYGATVRSAARSASPNEEMAEDLAQSIWAELHGLKVQEDGRPSGKLAYYSGAGSLGGWLRAVVGQLAIDRHRREARLVHTEEDADLDRLSRDAASEANAGAGFHSQPNPEDALTANLAAAAVENALSRALQELDDEDRLLVKLYYFDGLRLREAGAVLGFHEATASRRLTRIHSEVRKRVEALLMHEHGWTKSEATRSLSQIAAVLQTDVESLLKAPQPSLVPQAAAEGESAAI
ncbi:MAG TPA: sigma-70 family RNA polymerase sigma factor [Pyrinomonadaceae bacterium]|jgi:RNA polymerase sigma-70 factor|nr:sigma-70 family RNA polymerase sigma factor [Pyrinomonadaceae bacterium]